MTTILSHSRARSVYDRIGRLQDTQAFYEDRAVDILFERGDFEHAHVVVEFGAGTGRHAARLLGTRLPARATYQGYDVSPKMVETASRRLLPWGPRARVTLTDGSPQLELPDGSVDRVLSTYVVDLLSEQDVRSFLRSAHRVLRPGGRLCLASAAPGETVLSRVVMGSMAMAQHACPALVGGCRPLDLRPFFADNTWRVLHSENVRVFGISSQAIVAEPVQSP